PFRLFSPVNSVACGSRFPVSSISKNPMLDSFSAYVIPITGLSFDREATSETQYLSLQFPVPSLGYLRPQRKGQLVLFLRHFPQLDLSTVVAPSGGVQRTQSTRERPPHISPPKGRVSPIEQAGRRSPRTRRHPVFSCTCHASPRLHSGGVRSTMGCKQYNCM